MSRLTAHDQLAALKVARDAPVAALSHIRSPQRSRFTRSARRATGRARRAFVEDGPGHRLMDSLDGNAYFFTLTVADLDAGLSDDPAGLYGEPVSDLLAAAARAFCGPIYAVAEVGKGRDGRRGRLHVHVIAHREDGPAHVRRDTKRCAPIYDVFGLYRYLAKPPEPYSLAAELDAAAGRVMSRSGRLPNTRRHLITEERLAWAAAQCPIEPNPQPDPATTPREPQHGDLADLVDPSPETALATPQRPSQRAPRPFDQLAALLSPQPLSKKHTSVRHEPSTRRDPRACRHLRGARAPPPRPRPRRPARPPRPHHRKGETSERLRHHQAT